MPDLKHVLIVGNGINELDASGVEMLSSLIDRLRDAGLVVSLSGLNDTIIGVLKRTHLYEKIGEDHLYRNVNRALEAIHDDAHTSAAEEECPLTTIVYKALPVHPSVHQKPYFTKDPPAAEGN